MFRALPGIGRCGASANRRPQGGKRASCGPPSAADELLPAFLHLRCFHFFHETRHPPPPASRRAKRPAVRVFILFRASANCLSNRLTSGGVVPLPRATLALRLPLRIAGFRRSA